MGKKIFWDKGHGGTDPGACANGLKEADLTHVIVEHAMSYLVTNYTGFEQRTSRSGNQSVPLATRDDLADKWGADVFVSVHINAGGGNGYESYVYNDGVNSATTALQKVLNAEIMAAMRKFGDIKAHGGDDTRQANFAVLRETSMPAVLTENLYIDSSDHQYLKNPAFLKSVGEAHARGVAKYLGLPKKQSQQFQFYTGGYKGDGLVKIHNYMMEKGHAFTPSRNKSGHIFFTIGPFDQEDAANDVEQFLKDNRFWFDKQAK